MQTICNWLKTYNIPIRPKSEAIHLRKENHCNLSKEIIEWINGELLGDGCLQSLSKYSASFRYGSKYLEYIEYVRDTLKLFGIEQSGKIGIQKDKRYGSFSYKYTSRSYVELLPIYKQWYPNGKKIIPKDIELTPLTCRQWYIGDGSLIKRKTRRTKPYIILCTCGFLIEEVNWLVKKISDLGIKALRYSGNIIYIPNRFVEKFLNYIGRPKVQCYQYKWNC